MTGRSSRVIEDSPTALTRSQERASSFAGQQVWLSLWPLLFTGYAVLVWQRSLSRVDVRLMNDLGLVSVLPPATFVALGILLATFSLSLWHRQVPLLVVLIQVVVLAFMLFGLPSIVEDTPRFAVSWRHVGVTEYITRTHQADPTIDAYFNWPGFFILSAFATELAGLPNAMAFLRWAPVFSNLLYMGPLVMIFSAVTGDRRLIWLGVWFFYLANWIGQDYFSPQGLNYFLSLVIIGILVRWFKVGHAKNRRKHRWGMPVARLAPMVNWLSNWLAPIDAPNLPMRPWQRAGLLVIALLVFAVIVPSHQLTPFATLVGVTALVAFNRCTVRGLPLLMGIILATWVVFMAEAYLAGHLQALTAPVGKVDTALATNVTDRVQGSPQHVLVVYMRMVLSVSVWGLAALGVLRSIRRGYWDLTYALLAACPFPLLILQSYGGEMLLRVYLFALPFMAFFAAALFYTAPNAGTSFLTPVLTTIVSMALLAACLITRYGNERMDYFTTEEVAGVERLYSVAEPGALLLVGSSSLPWKTKDYEKYDYVSISHIFKKAGVRFTGVEIEAVDRLARRKEYPSAFLIITRSQKAGADLLGELPPGSLDRLEQSADRSPGFELIYTNRDAKIYRLVQSGQGGDR